MSKNTKAKYLLEDITFDHEGAHLAYTLGSGAASGKNKAFLFKGEDLAEENLDQDCVDFLKAMKIEEKNTVSSTAFVNTPNNEADTVLKNLDENESGLMLDSDNNAADGINKNNKENTMTQLTNEELIQKAAEAQVEELLKAKQEELLKAAKAEWEAEQASIALTKSNTAILKGLDFIAEDQVEAIVKATVVEGGEAILKAFEEAGKAVELAKAAEVEAKTNLEKFKEDFSIPEQVQAKVKELSFEDKKRAAVEKALKAK